MIIAQTERLLLRYFHILDREPMFRIFGDAEVMRFGDGVQTKEWVTDWLQKCLDHYYREWGFGPYAVIEKNTQEVIGYCGLFFFPDVNGRPEIEIGYRLARTKWGNGFATEAAKAVCDFAFHTLGVKRIIAMIDPQNDASIRVAQKLGMQYEGEVIFESYTHPDHVYVLLAS
jgi:RimJ/RimL family protein N-acetyltransferase